MIPRSSFVYLRHTDRDIWQAMGGLSYVRDWLCVSRCLAHSIRRPMMKNAPPSVFFGVATERWGYTNATILGRWVVFGYYNSYCRV